MGAAANFHSKCTKVEGIPQLGGQTAHICTNDTRAGAIFVALAIVFVVVFSAMALRSHLKRHRFA